MSTIVVKDVRYENEAKALLARGFTLVYLNVTPETQRARGRGDCAGSKHESERGVPKLAALCHISATLTTFTEAGALATKLLSM